MRVFALPDIHVDYEANARWIAHLPVGEYRDAPMAAKRMPRIHHA